MAEADQNRTITEYFMADQETMANDINLPTGTSVLLTPDSTPTKETSSRGRIAKMPSPDHDYAKSLPDKASPTKASLSRSRSDSRLDSPKPTQSKLTKSEHHSKSVAEEKFQKIPKIVIKAGKGRSGTSRKAAPKPKAAAVQSKDVKTTTSKESQRNPRSSSVPGNRSSPAKTTLLTDYYPIRRSSRVPSKDLKKQQQSQIEKCILCGCEDGLEVTDFVGKGRGVVATKPFKRGDFVVEYIGDTVDLTTAKKRETKYTDNPDFGCYMYYFKFRNKSYCVDATAESDKLGRLLNHSKANGNCVTRVVGIDDKPYLILVAARDIEVGEELLYDYGDRSKSSLEAHPWLSL